MTTTRRNLLGRLPSRMLPAALVLIVSAAALPGVSEEARIRAPRGILFVDNTSNHPPQGKDLFAYPHTDGVVEYVPWKTLEPAERQYNFSLLVKLIEQARAKGKRLAFGVLTGVHLPAWYRAKHPDQLYRYSQILKREDVGFQNAPREAVLPWLHAQGQGACALNQTFFDSFVAMLEALAAELKSRALLDSVQYVAITGPGIGNGLEVHLPVTLYADWERARFTKEARAALIESWVLCALKFKMLFPATPLAIAVADNFGCRPGSTAENNLAIHDATIGDEILRRIMAEETPDNQHVFPMGLWLADWNKWDGSNRLCAILGQWRAKGYQIGMQGHLMRHKDLAALEATIRSALAAKASWIELWYNDICHDGFEAIPARYAEHFNK